MNMLDSSLTTYLTDFRFSTHHQHHLHIPCRKEHTLNAINIVLRHCFEELFLRNIIKNLIADVSLHYNLILILIILRDARASRELVGELLCCRFQTTSNQRYPPSCSPYYSEQRLPPDPSQSERRGGCSTRAEKDEALTLCQIRRGQTHQ